jgi:hypothetical protein
VPLNSFGSPLTPSRCSHGSEKHREANDEVSASPGRTWFDPDDIGHRFALFDPDKSFGIDLLLKLFRLWRFSRRTIPGDNWRGHLGADEETLINSLPR